MRLSGRMDKLEKEAKPKTKIPIVAWQDVGDSFIVDGKPVKELDLDQQAEEAGRGVLKVTWAE